MAACTQRADISAILYMAVDCMREMLLEGKKVRLGDLGDFSRPAHLRRVPRMPTSSPRKHHRREGAVEPGQQFKTLRDEAEFNLVASRSAQAAVIKAIKEGKTSVDLNAPTTPRETVMDPGGSDSPEAKFRQR